MEPTHTANFATDTEEIFRIFFYLKQPSKLLRQSQNVSDYFSTPPEETILRRKRPIHVQNSICRRNHPSVFLWPSHVLCLGGWALCYENFLNMETTWKVLRICSISSLANYCRVQKKNSRILQTSRTISLTADNNKRTSVYSSSQGGWVVFYLAFPVAAGTVVCSEERYYAYLKNIINSMIFWFSARSSKNILVRTTSKWVSTAIRHKIFR